MPEMTPEKLREDALELDGTMQDIYTRRMIAAASAWEADLIMRGDGICLTHGVYSVDEDNPEGDCKVCRLLARIEALEKRQQPLVRLLGLARANEDLTDSEVWNDECDAALAAEEKS